MIMELPPRMPSNIITEKFLLFWETNSRKDEDLLQTLIRFNDHLQSTGSQDFAYAEDFEDSINHLVRNHRLNLKSGQYDKQIVDDLEE